MSRNTLEDVIEAYVEAVERQDWAAAEGWSRVAEWRYEEEVTNNGNA